MRALTWERVEAGRRLRSLSAALVLSTSFTTAPALAVDQTFGPGPLTGPIDLGVIDIFFSSASLTSLGEGFSFDSVARFENVGTIDADDIAVSVEGSTGDFINAGSIESSGDIAVRLENTLSTNSFQNKAGATISGANGGVSIENPFGDFTNAGSITSTTRSGVNLAGVDHFTNESTGVIEGAWDGVYFGDDVGDFVNRGSITGDDRGVYFGGTVDTFTNEQDAEIEGGYYGGYFGADVDAFTNAGTVTGTNGPGIYFEGVDQFTNTSTGTIRGHDEGVYFNLGVGTFSNAGTITGDNAVGVRFAGTVDRFTNESTGVIEGNGLGHGILFDLGVGAFTNRGRITSTNASGVHFDDAVVAFTNSGTISGLNGRGVYVLNNDAIETFVNEYGGIISGIDAGVYIDGSVASFINAGKITSTDSNSTAVWIGTASPDTGIVNSGTLTGGQFGLRVISGALGRITNTATGVIQGTSFAGAGIEYQGGIIDNSGTIKGYWGIAMNPVNPTQRGTVINSGTIEGTSGVAISFDYDRQGQSGDDSLTLLTGSKILGSVDFADGNDTLDVSGFRGNTVLAVDSLETVVAGSTLVASSLDGNGDGTVSIIDATGITTGGSTVMGEVAGAIGGEIAGALGGITGGAGPTEPMGYAPSRPVGAAEAAADELVATADPTGPEVWGKMFGGIANKTNDYNAVLGGIIAGSHVAVDANTRLGGVVSVSGSRFATVGGGQTVTGTIGAAGLYGSTDLGGVVVSYSVLGGVAANHSDRTVTAMVTETARADFGSWFWSPELGLSMPVPLFEGVETDAGFKLRYVGGGVGSYTEAGSSQNLSVGTAVVNLLDVRMELSGKALVAANDYGDVTFSVTAGVLAQHNFGSAVSIAGFPIATTPASFAYGAYGDVSLEAPIGATSAVSASTGVEVRSDGASSASANLGLSATF